MKYPTIKEVLLWIGSAIVLCIGTGWLILQAHAALPHRDAVPKDWYKQELKAAAEWRREHTAALKLINTDMNRLLIRLIGVMDKREKHESSSK